MTALDLADDSLGGVLALFSTFHTPPEQLPTVFAEVHRAPAPGGHLLLGPTSVPNEHLQLEHAYGGHPVSYEVFLLPAEHIAIGLDEAGFIVGTRLLQDADEGTKRPTACFAARKTIESD